MKQKLEWFYEGVFKKYLAAGSAAKKLSINLGTE